MGVRKHDIGQNFSTILVIVACYKVVANLRKGVDLSK